MSDIRQQYELQNTQQVISEEDQFTLERYAQFVKFLPKGTHHILDVGCNTGRGGAVLSTSILDAHIYGLDCVQSRLDQLPNCYTKKLYGMSTEIPLDDCSLDAIVAGEFIEHLYPSDVDKTFCEFQRSLKIGGTLIITTPNPQYLRNRLTGSTVYGVSHLTQHFPSVLKYRLMMHGFSHVKVYGSGKVSRYFGMHFPLLSVYGSYLVVAKKI